MTLSLHDLSLLESVSRVLLAPLAAPSVDAWRQDAVYQVRTLLRADHAIFGITGMEHPYVIDGVDVDTWQRYADYITHTQMAWGTRDAVVDCWLRSHHAQGGGAFSEQTIDHVLQRHSLSLRTSELMNGIAWPNRMYSLCGVTASVGTAQAGLQVTYERPNPDAAESNLALMRVLLPAFRGGLDAWGRFGTQRTTLDLMDAPLIVFSLDGMEVHRNPALERLLGADPHRTLVDARLARAGREMRGHGPGLGVPPTMQVETPQGTYTLRASLLPAGSFGPEQAVLVSVQSSATPALPAPDDVRQRFGLTRREAEVALLLAEGLSNAQMAERLFVSPHTARHHVENVMGKLEVVSRAAVAARLLASA